LSTSAYSLTITCTLSIGSQELKELAASINRVNVNVDIIIYIRDIVVGIRTHRLVHCGLTARASQDLVLVVKALTALFKREYVTPDLVSIAAEKVFGHRLVLKDEAYSHKIVLDNADSDDQSEINSMLDETTDILPADIVMEILRAVHVPL
jgi:MoxR-like ATPase